MTDAPTLELLDWLATRPRTYAETIETWQSHCPRLLVWEDALLAGLVRVADGHVMVTAAGEAALGARKRQPSPVVYSSSTFPAAAGIQKTSEDT